MFLAGQTVSLIGTWMQGLAQNWLVYRLTHSTLLMGTVGFCQYLPILVLGPFAGIAADRHQRRKLVILTQAAFLLQASSLAALTLGDAITLPLLLMLAVVWGVINAFDIPARQSMYIQLVGREDLPNAIALNSMAFNAARVLGPSMAGLAVAAFGEGVCFAINAASYLVVLASLLVMRVSESQVSPAGAPFALLRDGLAYAWRHRHVRTLLAVCALANLSMAPTSVLGPVFADAIFHRGSPGLGLLVGSLGLGALAGTGVLARASNPAALPRVVLHGAFLNCLALVVFALSPWFGLTLAAMGLCGFSIFRMLSAINTLIQTSIDDAYRGRVMSLYSITVVGMTPIGNLAAGAAAEYAGPRVAVFAGALLALGAATLWGRRETSS